MPPAHTGGMAVRLHHIVVDARDLPELARFWTGALGWEILSEREREIVIGPDANAPVGMCFMPVTEVKRSEVTTARQPGAPRSCWRLRRVPRRASRVAARIARPARGRLARGRSAAAAAHRPRPGR
jgi:catechol 2,3-dioxygenase-like lactoylglutathione lyase family enzyme